MLKEQEFEIKFQDLSGRIAKVLGIKWKTFSTMKYYALSFYEIIKWHSRCNLFEFALLQYKCQEVLANRLHQATKLLHKFENDLNFMIGSILLRELNFCGKRVIGYFKTSYANYIGKYITRKISNSSISQTCVSLVIGMSNYGSNIGKKYIRQFTTNLISTADDESMEDVHDATM